MADPLLSLSQPARRAFCRFAGTQAAAQSSITTEFVQLHRGLEVSSSTLEELKRRGFLDVVMVGKIPQVRVTAAGRDTWRASP
jgi:hypothetical protein